MNRFKSKFYNNSLELLISSFFGIFVIAYVIVAMCKNSTRLIGFLVASFVICLFFYFLSLIGKEKLTYFTISYSKLRPNYAWINQKVKRGRNEEDCPRDEFMKELVMLKTKLPDGKTYLCCTHELITIHIRRNFKIIKEFKAYDKNLKNLKKKLLKKRCKKCTIDCTIKDSEDSSFYALMFEKKIKTK